MSNLPYGLRRDPFSSPATLSAKEASRLIRRRIGAAGGDGGALFPIAACDEIHRLTGGVPDAILDLAAHALTVAGEAGAPAVSVAHVRKAAESVLPAAVGTRTEAPVAAVAPARTGSDDTREDEPETDEPEVVELADVPETEADDSSDVAEPEAEELEETPEDAPRGDTEEGDDDGLPPFHPAGIALPTKPSENLSSDAQEWVARFIPSQGHRPSIGAAARGGTRKASKAARKAREAAPAQVAKAPAPEPPARAERTSGRDQSASAERSGERAPAKPAAGPRAPAAGKATAGAGGARSSGRKADRAPSPLPTAVLPAPARRAPSLLPRRAPSRGVMGAIAALCAVALVAFYSVRTPFWFEPESRRAARVSPPPDRGSETATDTEPTGTVAEPPATAPGPTTTPARETPVHASRSSAAARESGRPASALRAAPADSARRGDAADRYGLEVASFIFEDRAKSERARIAAAGYPVRVVSRFEYGSRVYRVVVGSYARPGAAERAADSLLARGLVLQARVVSLSGR